MEKIIFANGQTPALNDTNLNQLQDNVEDALDLKADISSLSAVATSNNYNDLDNKPTIPTNSSFTLSGLSEKNYNNLTNKPTIPSKTSDITNDSGFIDKNVNNLTNYTKTSDLIEQGTWVPYLNSSDGTPGYNITKRQGNYIKIGNLVYISFYLKGRINSLGGNDNYGFFGAPKYPLEAPQGQFTLKTGICKNLLNDDANGTTMVVCRGPFENYSDYPIIKLMSNDGTTQQKVIKTNVDFEICGNGCYIVDPSK